MRKPEGRLGAGAGGRAGGSAGGDAGDGGGDGGGSARDEDEDQRTFLATHTSAELIPESGKVVLLDMDLPLRQALHALHDQVCVLSELRFPGC